MTAIQVAIVGTFILTGAYVGLCAGQLVAYYVTKKVLA